MNSSLDPKVYSTLTAYDMRHEVVVCDPDYADTAAFCDHYGFDLNDCANTIIIASKSQPATYVACVVLASSRLDVNKAVCKAMGVKKASFADSDQTRALTGMIPGGITIFGLPDSMRIFVDSQVMDQSRIVMGGGNRSSKVLLPPSELSKLSGMTVVPITKTTD